MSVVLNSILYFFGIGDNPIIFDVKNDSDAIRSDWERVGADIQKAMVRYEGRAG